MTFQTIRRELFVVNLLLFLALGVNAQDLTSDLEGYWPMDEGSGTAAADVSGHGRDAVFRNGEPQWVEGQFGSALQFGGEDDLEVEWKGIAEDLARTVSFWVRSDWTDIQANNGIVGWGLSSETGRKWHIRFQEDTGAIRTEPQGGQNYGSTPINDDEWHHVVSVFPDGGLDIGELDHYVDGELEDKNGNLSVMVDTATEEGLNLTIGSRFQDGQGDGFWQGTIDDLRIYSRALTEDEILALFNGEGIETVVVLQPGDADQDLDFDQLDLVRVQIAAKYLTGQAATWGEGDWNGAPGGAPGSPPQGDGLFDQVDIIAALGANLYLQGPYAVVASGGLAGDGQTSVVYDAGTGELSVDAPAGIELTSINIDSAAGIFTGEPAQNLGGSFDHDADDNIFKATFGGSFGSISFGQVAQAGLSEATVRDELSVVGSLAGGGSLGDVDLIYVPEPGTLVLLVLGLLVFVLRD